MRLHISQCAHCVHFQGDRYCLLILFAASSRGEKRAHSTYEEAALTDGCLSCFKLILSSAFALSIPSQDRYPFSPLGFAFFHPIHYFTATATVMAARKSARSGATQAKSGAARMRSQIGQISKQPVLQESQHGASVVMAKSVALSKTSNAHTTSTATTQHVSIEQSTQITQTLVHGCLSSVAFLRSIFPQNCFSTRYYHNTSSQWSYDDFASGANTTAGREIEGRDGAGKAIIALKRGISDRVDRFLSLMETGIFDALRRGYLKSLHLSVHESSERPSDVLEAWTWTFHYVASTDGTHTLESIDLKDDIGYTITLRQAKLSLNDFIRKLTGMCATLPALPETKSIILHVGYTNERPQEYFAPGFEQPAIDTARFPANPDWEKTTTEVGIMNAGHHTASLAVSYLQKRNADIPDVIPEGLEYAHEARLLDDVMKNLDERAKATQKVDANPEAAKMANHSVTPARSDDQGQLLQQETSSALEPFRASDTVSILVRSSTVDRMEQQQIRNMLQPSGPGSNTQATQPANSTPHDALGQRATLQLAFSQAKIDQVDMERSAMLSPRREISKMLTINEHAEHITVRCQCKYAEEEGDMINCEFCESYQHLHCYGFTGKDDARIPTIHMCYSCLLKEENEAFQQVRDQTVYRRALWLLQGTSYDSARSLGDTLDCTAREIQMLVQNFRSMGILVDSSKKTNQPIVLSKSLATEKVVQRFFDPTFGIEHHLARLTPVHTEAQSTPTDNRLKRPRDTVDDRRMSPAAKRRFTASASTFINGSELNTPKAARNLRPAS
ncbi:HORMA domain-containing protein [Pyrenochaeta sp. MPI-SDFR-AT-0127]|nr:HORMA domain-containing protein [Pyrenochaeta sp. MPI-SDFR-AT-0127]